MKIGFGFDAHRKISGRALVLGGVTIPSSWGLEAHSDGDVVTHAIMDALLGAANLRDKGYQFPPGDPRYKDIRSIRLLEGVNELLKTDRFVVGNLDVTVVCREPKLSPFVSQMKDILSAALEISDKQVSIKATTTEGMGFTGRGEGIAAFAVVLLEHRDVAQ